MEQFYIDRQFGQAIFIDVENGIVLRCYNESEAYNAKMDEKYKGKHINFLNEDFIGRAMKGTYHHLRPMAVTSAIQKLEAVKSHQRNIGILMSDHNHPKEKKEEFKKIYDELTIAQSMAESLLRVEKIRILNKHNFVI